MASPPPPAVVPVVRTPKVWPPPTENNPEPAVVAVPNVTGCVVGVKVALGAMINDPALMINPPVALLSQESVRLPNPFFVRVPVPRLTAPETTEFPSV